MVPRVPLDAVRVEASIAHLCYEPAVAGRDVKVGRRARLDTQTCRELVHGAETIGTAPYCHPVALELWRVDWLVQLMVAANPRHLVEQVLHRRSYSWPAHAGENVA